MHRLSQVEINKEFFGSIATSLDELRGVSQLVSLILNIAFVAAGVILLFFIVAGGVGMISSAGKNDPEKLEKSKQTVTSALIGFLIVFAAYWIVKLIEQITGIPIVSLNVP